MPQANPESLHGKCALITGASRRIGAAIAELLHHHGANVAIHYRGSEAHAAKLSARLNQHRTGSARIFKSDLAADGEPASLIDAVLDWSGQLDILINNASSFYATPLGTITEDQWTELVGSNLKAPLFLSQAAIPHLKASRGVIVNITDIHANRPLRDHTVYCVAKAGLAMLTRSLARDLAPEIRVNGVAPGAIAWPENDMTDAIKEHTLGQIPLGRSGNPADIAGCVLFLVRDATYSTGQIITIDGGRSLGWG
ncbi:MAG: pteridine reductase [Proteobacteria bacterium]|nr:pteridine reductase [Pseudomonadota bacterium]